MDELPIVDAHHHLWDLGRHHYPWLTDQAHGGFLGDYSALKRNYLPEIIAATAPGSMSSPRCMSRPRWIATTRSPRPPGCTRSTPKTACRTRWSAMSG
ncbi:MAG: hypothetical protein WDO24_13355 [Pseudomonadota bacterium]